MEIFKTHKASLILFLLLFLSCSLYLGQAQSPASLPQIDESMPLLVSPPFATTIVNNKFSSLLVSPPFATTIVNNKPPFAKSLNNQGQQSQLRYQQQEQQNCPQQGLNQPVSSFTQPFSSMNQLFSSFNQPFGASNQQGLVVNTPFGNGVSKQKTFIVGVVLVSLVTFMASFGYFV